MRISHDYSYLSKDADWLIEKKYAKLDIHSLNFDRDLSEEEKNENQRQSKMLTREQWGNRCDEFSNYLYNQMKNIVKYFNDSYDVHQISEEKSTMEHYKSNWDLFYYSNKGWNKKDYYDYFSISFNNKRLAENNLQLMNKIVKEIESMNIKNVYCRVQYSLRMDDNKLKNDALTIVESSINNFIVYNGKIGKFKVVDEHDGIKKYGFFPKGSKKKYYEIDNVSVIIDLLKTA